jgi:glycosyltransferase involved in cell wall biosynthesis
MNTLYLSHNGMTEPLGFTQVVPYLKGLVAAGYSVHLVAFEPASATAEGLAQTARELAEAGIAYTWLRRSASHSLGVKVWESAEAAAVLFRLSLRLRPRVIHARSYLPGAVCLALSKTVPRLRFVFDCRGLAGDEYVDGGHWSKDSLRYRLLKSAERRLFGQADAVVTLTERLKRWLVDEVRLVRPDKPVVVIPCCVDLERYRIDEAARVEVRAELGAGDRFVLGYAGNLGSWYCEEEMVRLFAHIRRRRPALFVVFSQARADRLIETARSEGVPEREIRVQGVDPRHMPRMLSGVDAAISFARPWFSKIASSPVKVAEYLAVGVPVIMNRGIGDGDEIIDGTRAAFDAGSLADSDLERVANALCDRDFMSLRPAARAAAARWFSLAGVGVPRYRELYSRLTA